jgi:hypothetical protein
MESLLDSTTAHWEQESSVAPVGARASWTAATEFSESPLWIEKAVLTARFGILSGARAGAVTSRTPSPQSKTWRQIRLFMGREWASGINIPLTQGVNAKAAKVNENIHRWSSENARLKYKAALSPLGVGFRKCKK